MEDGRARELFERHRAGVVGYLRRRTGRADVAEDLAQDVFLRVVRGLNGYAERGRERSWLYRIAHNRWLDWARASGRVVQEAIRGTERSLDAPAHLRVALFEALQQVDALDAELFLLRETSGLSYHELAETTGLTPAAVRSRLFRVRLALRERLFAPGERSGHERSTI